MNVLRTPKGLPIPREQYFAHADLETVEQGNGVRPWVTGIFRALALAPDVLEGTYTRKSQPWREGLSVLDTIGEMPRN